MPSRQSCRDCLGPGDHGRRFRSLEDLALGLPLPGVDVGPAGRLDVAGPPIDDDAPWLALRIRDCYCPYCTPTTISRSNVLANVATVPSTVNSGLAAVIR